METPTHGYRLSVEFPTSRNQNGKIQLTLLELTADPERPNKLKPKYLGQAPRWEWQPPANVEMLRRLYQWLLERKLSETAAGELFFRLANLLRDLALLFSSELLDPDLAQVYFEGQFIRRQLGSQSSNASSEEEKAAVAVGAE